jgi:hypothetical protein
MGTPDNILFIDFRNSIMESSGFSDALVRFMEREGIYGYEQEVESILRGNSINSVITDIQKYFRDKEGIEVSRADIMDMDRESMLDRYLEIRGIKGYTGSIIDLWGQYRKAGMTKTIKAKDKDLYHLKPSKDTLRIWCWDNKRLEGIPTLITVEDIYGRENFGQVNPSDYVYV